MISFYLAASFARKTEAIKLRDLLVKIGLICNARWLSIESKGYNAEIPQEYPVMDDLDVTRSDILITLTGDNKGHGGRHTELGIAIALRKMVFLVGPKEQIFHSHPNVIVCSCIEELKAMLLEKLYMIDCVDWGRRKFWGAEGRHLMLQRYGENLRHWLFQYVGDKGWTPLRKATKADLKLFEIKP